MSDGQLTVIFENNIMFFEVIAMPNPNLKNRVVPNSAIDKKLYEKLKIYSKETGIPISKLLDKAISLFLKSTEK